MHRIAKYFAPALAAASVGILFVQFGCSKRGPDAEARPDLILISIDTLRADHLELYGHSRTTAPRLAQLGRTGITFERAVAAAPWTLPSLASIHTGLAPSRHGAVDNATPISAQSPTVASVLKANGYKTLAVTSHVFAGSSFGFARGFDRFDQRFVQSHDGSSSEVLTEAALASFARSDDAPTFLWVHYFDPHYSYERHSKYGFATGESGRFNGAVVFQSPEGRELFDASPEEKRYMQDVYDEEIAHTDHHIGALIDGVRSSARGRGAIFIVTSDHGEAFFEHGRFGHGFDVYDELTHVPLIIGGDLTPEMKGLSVDAGVEIASIATTLLALAGVEQDEIPGTNLIDVALGNDVPTYVFAEGSYARGPDARKLSVEKGRWKLIRHLDDGRLELYDRNRDPGETRNLADDPESASILAELHSVLNARMSEHGHPAPENPRAELTDDEREKLEALGYLESGAERIVED